MARPSELRPSAGARELLGGLARPPRSPVASARGGSRAWSRPSSGRARTTCRSSGSAWACRWRSWSSRATCAGWRTPTRTEFAPECARTRSSALLDSQRAGHDKGGTMRLGAYPCVLKPGSRAARDLRRRGDQRAPPAPLRGQQRVPRAAPAARHALQRHVAGRRAGRDHRDPRAPLVRGRAVPSGAQVPAHAPASAVRRRSSAPPPDTPAVAASARRRRPAAERAGQWER